MYVRCSRTTYIYIAYKEAGTLNGNLRFNTDINTRLHKHSGRLKKNIIRDKYLMLLVLPVVIYYIIFKYIPIGGILIAFQDYLPSSGFFESEWVGFKWFMQFFNSIYFTRLIRNTFLISLNSLILGFPIPIFFALMLNETKDGIYKRSVQTISYLPHFVSLVIIVGMLTDIVSSQGVLNRLVQLVGGQSVDYIRSNQWFRTLYIVSGIWQSFGWNSIIYLAAITGISSELYEAATVDGANRFRRIWHITLPGILPTIVILLIMNCGRMLSVGSEKIILMYSPIVYETGDVISTYVYRRGILGADYSFSAAVDLFNNSINFILLLLVNYISKRVTETSLW